MTAPFDLVLNLNGILTAQGIYINSDLSQRLGLTVNSRRKAIFRFTTDTVRQSNIRWVIIPPIP